MVLLCACKLFIRRKQIQKEIRKENGVENKIVLENIEKTYCKDRPVIEGLNLAIGEGSLRCCLVLPAAVNLRHSV